MPAAGLALIVKRGHTWRSKNAVMAATKSELHLPSPAATSCDVLSCCSLHLTVRAYVVPWALLLWMWVERLGCVDLARFVRQAEAMRVLQHIVYLAAVAAGAQIMEGSAVYNHCSTSNNTACSQSAVWYTACWDVARCFH